MISVRAQALVCGGGIAGLWTLRRLVAQGFDACLVEADALGSKQTLGAQGILHRGLKYSLVGVGQAVTETLRTLPQRWLDCVDGGGELELAKSCVRARRQCLWAEASWLAGMAARVGAAVMQSGVRKLSDAEWPAALANGGYRGAVYELDEPVLDVKTVLESLLEPVRDRVFKGEITGLERAADGRALAVHGPGFRIEGDAFIFTAGAGNERAVVDLGLGRQTTQRRPLKQLMVRGRLPTLFGHCLKADPKPVVTITTHALNGGSLWYLGGGVAERNALQSDETAIRDAALTLRTLFPLMDWTDMEWAAWSVDRAEPNASGRLPDGPALSVVSNAAVCWPAKFVCAPLLADQAADFVGRLIQPAQGPATRWPLPQAAVGSYPWETAVWRRLP